MKWTVDIPKAPRTPYYGQGPYWTATWNRMREDAEEIYDFDLGLEFCEWDPDWVHLNGMKDKLIRRFNSRYAYREVAHETPQAMQHYLQERLWIVGAKCEMMMRTYLENDVERLGVGYDEHIDFHEHGTNNSNTSVDSTNMNEFEDTPTDSSTPAINNPTNRTKDSNTSTGDSSSDADIVRTTDHTKQQFDQQAIDYANNLFKKWEDIDDLFISGFEPLFLGLLERFSIDNI